MALAVYRRRRDKGGMAEWGRRWGENKRFFSRARRAHVSSHSPLAKTSRLMTPTEWREKNRLPAVYSTVLYGKYFELPTPGWHLHCFLESIPSFSLSDLKKYPKLSGNRAVTWLSSEGKIVIRLLVKERTLTKIIVLHPCQDVFPL